MVRATITVKDQKEARKAYEIVKNNFNVIRIKNKLEDQLRLIHLNVLYGNGIVGELQIKLGYPASHFDSVHFLYEIARADTAE